MNLISSVPNERDGKFIVSMFVYSAYKEHGKKVRATPDGRYNGDMLNQGIAPGRVKKAESLICQFDSTYLITSEERFREIKSVQT